MANPKHFLSMIKPDQAESLSHLGTNALSAISLTPPTPPNRLETVEGLIKNLGLFLHVYGVAASSRAT